MLNINFQPQPPKIQPPKIDKYSNPVSVWKVETEGDCEGRSIKDLGVWQGHVAEIAFHLAGKSHYELKFTDLKGTRTAGEQVPTNNITKHNYVWISFNIDSKTWDMKPDARALFVANLLNAGDQLDVYGSYRGCTYYAGVCLVLKENQNGSIVPQKYL